MHGKALTVHIARHRQQPEPSRASNALNPHAELVARSMMRQHRVPAMNASRCPLATASGAFAHSPRGSQRSSRHCPTPPASLATSTRRRTFNGARSSRQLRVVDTMGAQIHHRGRPEEAHCAPVHDRPSSPPSSGATHEQVQQPVSESRMYIDDRAFVTIACHDGKLMRDGKVVENKSINASTSPGNSHVARSESFRNKSLVEKMRMEEFIHRVLPRFSCFVKLRDGVGAARVAPKSSKAKAEASTAKAFETRCAAPAASAAPV